MRKGILTLHFFWLICCIGCAPSGPPIVGSKQQTLLVTEAREITSQNKSEKFKYINLSSFNAPTIKSLNPEKVVLRREGLYIRLGDGFVVESGYCIPASSRNDDEFKEGHNPSYKKIADSLFKYRYQ